MTKLEAYLVAHGIRPIAVSKAIGLKSRGDFRNRMIGRLSQSGKPMQFSEDQKRRIAEFVRADVTELF